MRVEALSLSTEEVIVALGFLSDDSEVAKLLESQRSQKMEIESKVRSGTPAQSLLEVATSLPDIDRIRSEASPEEASYVLPYDRRVTQLLGAYILGSNDPKHPLRPFYVDDYSAEKIQTISLEAVDFILGLGGLASSTLATQKLSS